RIACHVADLLDDVARRRQVRIAHAEIDNVFSRAPRLQHQSGHFGKHVRRELIESMKVKSVVHVSTGSSWRFLYNTYASENQACSAACRTVAEQIRPRSDRQDG